MVGEVLFIGKQQTFGLELGCGHEMAVHCMDQSDYEGADIIWDLGYPVPDELHGRFDFIYDGGCLDNMFNPAQAIMNFTRMLKPGGRLICLESACSFSWAYVMYSPGWFNDYFEANGFTDWSVHVCSFTNRESMVRGPWKAYRYDPGRNRIGPAPPARKGGWVILAIAEKGETTSFDVQPLQYQYRNLST